MGTIQDRTEIIGLWTPNSIILRVAGPKALLFGSLDP